MAQFETAGARRIGRRSFLKHAGVATLALSSPGLGRTASLRLKSFGANEDIRIARVVLYRQRSSIGKVAQPTPIPPGVSVLSVDSPPKPMPC